MNCDQAFEHLTDPILVSAPELTRHLEQCPRCRQMQETLEPALSLFEVRYDDEDSAINDEDQFWSRPNALESLQHDLNPDTVRLARQSAAELTAWSSAGRDRVRLPVCMAFQYAAVFLAGALTALGGFYVLSDKRPANFTTAVPSIQNCSWQHPKKLSGVPDAEIEEVVMSCVSCHLSNSRRDPKTVGQSPLIHSLVKSCVACHFGDSAADFAVQRPCTDWGSAKAVERMLPIST